MKNEKPKKEIAGKNHCQQEFSFGLSNDQMPNGLRYLRWGGRRNAVQIEKATSVENCLKMAQNPQRQVHALLGNLYAYQNDG